MAYHLRPTPTTGGKQKWLLQSTMHGESDLQQRMYFVNQERGCANMDPLDDLMQHCSCFRREDYKVELEAWGG
jgi:hypothetical protein